MKDHEQQSDDCDCVMNPSRHVFRISIPGIGSSSPAAARMRFTVNNRLITQSCNARLSTASANDTRPKGGSIRLDSNSSLGVYQDQTRYAAAFSVVHINNDVGNLPRKSRRSTTLRRRRPRASDVYPVCVHACRTAASGDGGIDIPANSGADALKPTAGRRMNDGKPYFTS